MWFNKHFRLLVQNNYRSSCFIALKTSMHAAKMCNKKTLKSTFTCKLCCPIKNTNSIAYLTSAKSNLLWLTLFLWLDELQFQGALVSRHIVSLKRKLATRAEKVGIVLRHMHPQSPLRSPFLFWLGSLPWSSTATRLVSVGEPVAGRRARLSSGNPHKTLQS